VGVLKDKVAVITGAGSRGGQGETEARLFAAEGAKVVIADLGRSDGESIANEIGESARFYELDVTDSQRWETVTRTVKDEFGRIDILVNNAGIWLDKGVLDTTPEEYRRVVDINQTGVFLGMWAVAPVMKLQGSGAIVNISSTAGLKGAGMPHAYAASKWAVRGMSRAAAHELGSHGIRVNSVLPGFIDTPMIEGGREVLDHLASLVPSKRVGKPEEVAALVLFLASDAASYISGAEVTIDSAFTA